MEHIEDRHRREIDELSQRHRRELKETQDRHRRELQTAPPPPRPPRINNHDDDWAPREQARRRDSPPRPRSSQDKGRSKGDKGDRGKRNESNPGRPDPGELTHARMMRLLKLLQRSRSFQPPNHVLERWNVFCEEQAKGTGNKPMRDPKQIDMEVIIDFLLSYLPRAFWSILVKKMQGQGREIGFPEYWNNFCDEFAPHLSDSPHKSLRDPKQIDPELLLAFISSTVERGGELGDYATQVIDEYTFDFREGQGRREQHGDDNAQDSRRGPGGKGPERDRDDRHEGKGKGKNNVNGEEKAFVEVINLNIEDLDPRFPFGGRIIGKGGRNVKHIREHTGADAWLGGRGSGRLERDTNQESPLPLHIKVTAEDRDRLDQACKIASDLIDSVHEEYFDWLDGKQAAHEDDGPRPHGGRKGDRGGKGNSDGPRGKTDQEADRPIKRQRRD